MTSRQTLTDKHNYLNDAIFHTKSTLLTVKRHVQNLRIPLKRFKKEGTLSLQSVISFSESELWNPHDNPDNWVLTAGKIENLRIAVRQLNGLEVKANDVFSFWKHIGKPGKSKGYVIGREIREGCIVPTIAGGLCQLSNALYDAALKAEFEIVERHRHTKVIKGSLAEQDRDATVKWNYIDLRFKSRVDFRIEASLSSDKLIVVFKSEYKNSSAEKSIPSNLRAANKLNDCYSCGNFACYKHPDRTAGKQETAITTFILDEKWPEYDDYISELSRPNDFFILSFKKNRFFKTNRYSWSVKNTNNVKITQWQGLRRALMLRLAAKSKNNIFELSLQLDKNIAQRASQLIPIESTHLIVSQNLLPFLYETGAMGGRTFDVLMTRLPAEKLHERLDLAFRSFPESKTLNDFRAPQSFIDLENNALTKARQIITPHPELAELFKNKSLKLNWSIPKFGKEFKRGTKILFPASSLGRKGAYEVKKLAKELNFSLVVTGIPAKEFWQTISVEKFNGNFEEIGLVLYPTYIEHQPRLLLTAVSKGIRVVTSSASGLQESEQVRNLPIGEYELFKEEVLRILKMENGLVIAS